MDLGAFELRPNAIGYVSVVGFLRVHVYGCVGLSDVRMCVRAPQHSVEASSGLSICFVAESECESLRFP